MDNTLRAALAYDDHAEDRGIHPDQRRTCHQCQSWADHAHHPITNQRISWAAYRAHRASRAR